MSTGQEYEITAATGGHGQLRASHADREEVVDLLKTAFVAGRLTRDELDTRVGQALASKTYAQLGALTSDISAAPIEADPAPEPPRAHTRPPKNKNKVARSATGAVIAAGVAAVTVLAAAGAHLRPTPDVMACQSFYAWVSPGNGGPYAAGMLLGFSVSAAHQGSDRTLTGDLEALQQAVVQYENPIEPAPSAAALQADRNRVYAAMDRVNAACVPYSS